MSDRLSRVRIDGGIGGLLALLVNAGNFDELRRALELVHNGIDALVAARAYSSKDVLQRKIWVALYPDRFTVTDTGTGMGLRMHEDDASYLELRRRGLHGDSVNPTHMFRDESYKTLQWLMENLGFSGKADLETAIGEKGIGLWHAVLLGDLEITTVPHLELYVKLTGKPVTSRREVYTLELPTFADLKANRLHATPRVVFGKLIDPWGKELGNGTCFAINNLTPEAKQRLTVAGLTEYLSWAVGQRIFEEKIELFVVDFKTPDGISHNGRMYKVQVPSYKGAPVCDVTFHLKIGTELFPFRVVLFFDEKNNRPIEVFRQGVSYGDLAKFGGLERSIFVTTKGLTGFVELPNCFSGDELAPDKLPQFTTTKYQQWVKKLDSLVDQVEEAMRRITNQRNSKISAERDRQLGEIFADFMKGREEVDPLSTYSRKRKGDSTQVPIKYIAAHVKGMAGETKPDPRDPNVRVLDNDHIWGLPGVMVQIRYEGDLLPGDFAIKTSGPSGFVPFNAGQFGWKEWKTGTYSLSIVLPENRQWQIIPPQTVSFSIDPSKEELGGKNVFFRIYTGEEPFSVDGQEPQRIQSSRNFEVVVRRAPLVGRRADRHFEQRLKSAGILVLNSNRPRLMAMIDDPKEGLGTLAHLFAQAYIEAFWHDAEPEFRDAMQEKFFDDFYQRLSSLGKQRPRGR